jgi:hypothetical protein
MLTYLQSNVWPSYGHEAPHILTISSRYNSVVRVSQLLCFPAYILANLDGTRSRYGDSGEENTAPF